MEDGRIDRTQITAISSRSAEAAARYARLNRRLGNGAWVPNNPWRVNQYLQIDLGPHTVVHGVATQGKATADQYVTKYILRYSDDGTSWTDYGVNGTAMVSAIIFKPPFKTF